MSTVPRKPNGFLVFLGSIVALLVVALILIWSIAAGPKPQELDKSRGEQRLATREKLEKEAYELLGSSGFVDKAKGIVHVPVVETFASVAAELKAKKAVASAVKVEAPLPMPVIDPTSTEPPTPLMPSAPQGADTIHFQAPEPVKPSAALSIPASSLTAAVASPIHGIEPSKQEK